jgi:hypothetical protein
VDGGKSFASTRCAVEHTDHISRNMWIPLLRELISESLPNASHD